LRHLRRRTIDYADQRPRFDPACADRLKNAIGCYKAIFAEIDNSLRRLGMDYVDLYQIHRFDHETPIEETLEALHDVVKAGKARYIGASSMHAWQFARALGIAEKSGWARFVSMQNLVNLLYREEEREMLPLCEAEGIGVIPWSPQARGKLSRDWDYSSMRTETDEALTRLFAKTQEADKKVVDRVAEVANARGIPRAQVAVAWLLAKPVITAPIVGATKLHHLDDALASVAVKLTAQEIAALEEPYVPHPSRGTMTVRFGWARTYSTCGASTGIKAASSLSAPTSMLLTYSRWTAMMHSPASSTSCSQQRSLTP
jgi:aryl-alcohol dehydrogenase-like predicted oxidoreductase